MINRHASTQGRKMHSFYFYLKENGSCTAVCEFITFLVNFLYEALLSSLFSRTFLPIVLAQLYAYTLVLFFRDLVFTIPRQAKI